MSRLSAFAEVLLPRMARRVAAPIILLVLVLYEYVTGPLVFGTLWSSSGFDRVIWAYLAFILAAFAIGGIERTDFGKHLFKPVSAALWEQALLFGGVAIALNTTIFLSGIRQSLGPTTTNILPIVLLQLTVSGSEELFFRGALFKTGPLISSAVFAAFHGLAYSLSIVPLIIAFVAGLAFYYIYAATKDRYGLALNTAAHFAYNCALLGILFIGPIGCFLFGGLC